MHALRDIADLLLARMVKDPRAAALPRPLTGADLLSLHKRQAGMNRLINTFSPHHADLTPQLSA